MTAEDLATLWKEHQNAQFPYECREIEVLGVTLLKMDVTLGQILTASLQRDGVPRPISRDDRVTLTNFKALLDTALHEKNLEGKGLDYFTRLQKITGELLHGEN